MLHTANALFPPPAGSTATMTWLVLEASSS